MMRRFGKIFAFIASLLTCLGGLFAIGQASWAVGQQEKDIANSVEEKFNSSTENPVAYIANKGTYFSTIPAALNNAQSGDIVIAIPAEAKNYNSSTNNVANSTLDKKTYTISSDCEIKEGVTFVIPTDKDSVSSVTSATSLNTYIKSMKEDDHSHGSGYGSYATSNEARFLRVTVNVSAGVTLTNKGTLVVSGYLNSGTSNGGLVGNTSHSYSRLLLDSGSKIIQDSSTAMTYCFGYISEKAVDNGSQSLFNSGKLYIPFILDDYRGFSFSWSLTYNSSEALSTYHSSAFNQFEFINIDSAVTIKSGVEVYGDITIYLTYPTQGIDQCFPKELSIVGTTSSSFCQLTDSSYSQISYKYDKTSRVSKIIFYGGMTINPLSLSLSASIVTVNLSTTNSYLPISYRQNIEFSKADGQAAAIFNFSKQMLKVLPGAEITVNDGATLTGKSMICYSAFYDGALGNGQSSVNGYNSFKYPIKNGGIVKILSGGNLTCTNSIAGTFYSATGGLTTPSTNAITAFEPWSISSSGTFNPAWKISEYLQIREELQSLSLDDMVKQKICVGLNTFNNYSSFVPRLNLITNSGAADQRTHNIYGYQKVIHLTSIANYRLEFVNNIYTAFKNSSRYSKNESVSFNASNSNCCAINSTLSISNNSGGVNEFNVQSIAVTCSTPMVDGHYPLYPDTSVQCVANVVDIEKSYEKTIVWTSSDVTKATVNSSGLVTGVALGFVRITATCDGVSGYVDLEVISEPSSLTEISSIYIRDQNGKTSEGDPTIQSSDGSFNAHAQYSNGSNITFSVVINPADAPYASIKWTFTASAVGRQYMNDDTQKTETVENVTSVTIHIVSGSGADDDKCTLLCEVTDLNSNKHSSTFIINHKKDTSICVTENTLVTMSDGSFKPIKDVKLGDMVKTWSFESGSYVDRPTIWYESGIMEQADIITIVFDDGSKIEAIWQQSFFDADLLDYVTIDSENYESFIGKRLLAYVGGSLIGTKIVVNTFIETRDTEYYEIDTMFDYQYLANSILTVEPTLHEHVWFDVTPEFKYDPIKMAEDLALYGPLDYELVKDLVSYDQYLWWAGPYLNVPIGKGYFDLDYLIGVIKQFINSNYDVA